MKRWLCVVAAMTGIAASYSASAQVTEKAVPTTPAAETPPPAPNTGGLSLTGGVDFTTAYFFRGYNQEDTGLIVQPYATLTASVYKSDAFNVNVYGGTWNSFHSEQTLAAGTGPSSWYEDDLFGGVDFIVDKFTLGAIYTFYQYPNGAFETIQEIGFKVSYDDTDAMKGFGVPVALKPYAAIYIETDDGNGEEDTYLEAGVTPSFALGSSGITLSVPVLLGMSTDGYYLQSDGHNSFFGYGSIGLVGTVPLPLPSKYGAWNLVAGVQYLKLFADSAEAVNDGGEDYDIIGKIGVAFTY